MKKVLAVLAALALFAALPAIASATHQPGHPCNPSPNHQCHEDGDGDGQRVIQGGTNNQNAACQQYAGRDANCDISQNRGGVVVGSGGHGGGVGHFGGGVSSAGGVGGGLARTGSDAWVLALIGGVALAGGLGLLVAQRRRQVS